MNLIIPLQVRFMFAGGEEYVVTGGDCGCMYVWDKTSGLWYNGKSKCVLLFFCRLLHCFCIVGRGLQS